MNIKLYKKALTRNDIIWSIIAIIVIIGVISAMSAFIYNYMLKVEEDNCWNIMNNSAQAIEKEINIQIDNNVNVLKLVSGAMVREQRTEGTTENLDAIVSHLNDFQGMTIFDRIDLLYENGDILLQTGGICESGLNFGEIAAKGIHISGRITDAVTGKEMVSCAVPVIQEQKAVAILMGVIQCERFPQIFRTGIYDGHAYICIVDRSTGDFIMDDWHSSLGNLYEMKKRQTLPGYEKIDLREEVSQGDTGVIAYKSDVNGKSSYMFFQPIKNRNWQLIIVAQEDVVFSSLIEMKRMLGYMLGIVGVLLIGYLAWSLIMLSQSIKKKVESEKHSYIDNLTGIYNQNKFTQILEEYENNHFTSIGVMFLDLNGLKYTNDNFGYDVGNHLLKNTAQILSNIFGTMVYRIGSDEFVVLTANLTKEEFMALCIQAKNTMQENEIEAAMGITWHDDGKSVKAQLKEADDLMYLNKRSYHECNQSSAR